MGIPWGFDGEHGTDVRPVHVAAGKQWAKDESAPGANDGTRLTASLINRFVGNIRYLAESAGVTFTETSDHDVADAIVAYIAVAVVDALALKAPLASPALTGTPTAPTANPGTNTTQIATTGFVQAAVAALIASSPGALDTLNELAAALGNDANFATTMTNALATKIAIAAIINDLTTGGTAVPLSAEQGKALKTLVDGKAAASHTHGTADIANSAITYAKIQNVSTTDRLLGRWNAGAGVVEEVACTGAGRALIDDVSAAAQRTTLGVGTGDSPQFANVELGNSADTTLARAAAGQMSVEGSLVFQRNNILGTVAQSGGVPTGAVVERGSNAGGEYVRFADGTQICTQSSVTFSYNSADDLTFSWTFPAVFASTPSCAVMGPSAGASFTGLAPGDIGFFRSGSGGTTLQLILSRITGATAFNSGDNISGIRLMAIGRWF